VAFTVGVQLTADHVGAIETIFERVRERPGCSDLAHPVPHLTLLVLLEAPSLDRIDHTLARIALRASAFFARARGFGVFADEHDQLALYTPVVRNRALNALHRSLFDAFTSVGARVDGHYQPDTWLPHVTLCNRHLTPDTLREIVTSMASARMITWRLRIDHLARFGRGAETRTFPLRSICASTRGSASAGGAQPDGEDSPYRA
jgi:2'-5' RNA ligase